MYIYTQAFCHSADVFSVTHTGKSYLFWLANGIQMELLTHSLQRENIHRESRMQNLCVRVHFAALNTHLMFHLFL